MVRCVRPLSALRDAIERKVSESLACSRHRADLDLTAIDGARPPIACRPSRWSSWSSAQPRAFCRSLRARTATTQAEATEAGLGLMDPPLAHRREPRVSAPTTNAQDVAAASVKSDPEPAPAASAERPIDTARARCADGSAAVRAGRSLCAGRDAMRSPP